MLSEYEATMHVVLLLKERGYTVENAPESSSRKGVRSDLLGWGADAHYVTRPLVAVEIKLNARSSLSDSVKQLKSVSDRVGTRDHFIFDGQSWFAVDPNFLGVEPSDGPAILQRQSDVIFDRTSVSRLISKPLFEAADRLRGQLPAHSLAPQAVEELLQSARIGDRGEVYLRDTPNLGIDAFTLIMACTDYIEKMLGRYATYTTPLPVTSFLFNLLGSSRLEGQFIDPFSGTGSMMREFVTRSRRQGFNNFTAQGQEINREIVEFSNLLNRFLDPSISTAQTDTFSRQIPACDFSVSVPPFGLRLNEFISLPFGQTKSGDVAAIARIASSLNPGGVCVVLTPPSWTWNREGSQLREWLHNNFHVVALLSLPPILKGITSIPPIALVLKNSAPGETIVGTLGDDWLSQSEPGGELFQLLDSALA